MKVKASSFQLLKLEHLLRWDHSSLSRSIPYCFHTTLRRNSPQQMFIKLQVSSIFKEKTIPKSVSGYRTQSVGSAVHHPYHKATEDWLAKGDLNLSNNRNPK